MILDLKRNLKYKLIETNPLQTRIYAGAAIIKGAFYQVGGSTVIPPIKPSLSVTKFERGKWSNAGHLPNGPLINPAVANWKNRIVVFEGGRPSADGMKTPKPSSPTTPKKTRGKERPTCPTPSEASRLSRFRTGAFH